MELIDVDGDHLQFLIDKNGTLSEYVNGKLEIEKITFMQYSLAGGVIKDDKGMFQLTPADQVNKALGLRALAARSGINWLGDEPAPATELILTDTDGDKLEFRLTDLLKLQEYVNGELEIAEIRKLTFDLSSGLVTDETGSFNLPFTQSIEKAAVLRSIAHQAGVEWAGDEPSQRVALPASAPAVLDIENCASDWEYACPRRWEALSETANSNERFCETCKEIVYLCSTEKELSTRVEQRRCVAFDLRADANGKASSKSSSNKTDEPQMTVRVALLSGDELPPVRASPSQTVESLKRLLAPFGIPVDEQRLVVEDRELLNVQTLVEAGISSEVTIQLARVPPPKPTPAMPPRRLLGKRRIAR